MSAYKPATRKVAVDAFVRVYLNRLLPQWDTPRDKTPDELRSEGEDIRKAILRHVDVPSSVVVVVKCEDVCVHCGRDPEPMADGWPQCCTAAEGDAREAGVDGGAS